MSWTAGAQILHQAFTFVVSIILARLLGPEAYGLIGMVLVFANFALLFGDLALGPALIQRRDLEARHLNSAFWTTFGLGAALSAVMALAAPLIARFYSQPLLAPMAAVLGIKFILAGGNVVQKAILSREMRFRQLAMIEVSGVVVGGVTGVALAFLGFGVWSLVAQSLTAVVVSVVVAWMVSSWRPALTFDKVALKELWKFGGYYFSFNVVNYWARNLDSLLIGRFIGAAPLAIYSRAYTFMLLPLTQVAQVLGKVMFPALSSIQADKDRVKRAYLKATGVIALITFPMMVGLHCVSEQFVTALLGERWLGAIPILKLFCWVGLLQSVTSPLGWLTTSQGRTRLHFWVGIMNAAACAVAFLIGLRWGVNGVAMAYLICNLVMWYPVWRISGSVVELGFVENVKNVAGSFLCALGMGAAVYGVQALGVSALRPSLQLLILVPWGALVYLGIIQFVKLRPWENARGEFLDLYRRKFAGAKA